MGKSFWERVAPWGARDVWWVPAARAGLGALVWIPVFIFMAFVSQCMAGCSSAPTPTPAPGEPYVPAPIGREIVGPSDGDDVKVAVTVGSLRQALSDSLSLDRTIAYANTLQEEYAYAEGKWREWTEWGEAEWMRDLGRVGMGVGAGALVGLLVGLLAR